jgi:diguanylate cyclase (GGDEF)-like protein
MAVGDFRSRLVTGGDDALGRLGIALAALGDSFERQTAELRALSDVAARISAGLTVDDVLNHVYESFHVLIPYDRLGCALIENGEAARAIWARSRSGAPQLDKGYSWPLGGSSLADIVKTGRPRILNDLRRYLRDHPDSDSTRRIVADGIRSSLTCPLVADGRPVGFLFFSSMAPGTYTEAHTAVYEKIAAQISFVVEKSRTHDELVATQRRLEEANAALAEAAYTDALTGVPSRRYFDLVLDREWKRATRYLEPLSVILIDVDHFKAFNDTYGHPAGDRCLRDVAQAIETCAKRGLDVVARLGGEEFVALLPRTGPEDALGLAERIRGRVASLAIPNERSSVGPNVTISLGVAGGLADPHRSAAELVKAADEALYRAKGSGRDRACAAAW